MGARNDRKRQAALARKRIKQPAAAVERGRWLFYSRLFWSPCRVRARPCKSRAVAHSMLIAIYHVLKNNMPFHDLGSNYYDTFNREHKIKSYLKRLQALGWQPDAGGLSA